MTNRKNNKETRMESMKKVGLDTSKFFNLNMNVPVGSKVVVTIDGVPYTIDSTTDAIVKDIVEKGYVHNPKTDGRFVCAQTFKMLNEPSYNQNTCQYEYGWDAYLRNMYGYMYQFDMMTDELHRLSKMEQSKDPDFVKLNQFFSKQVVIGTCEHYMRQLKKYIKHAPSHKCKGKPYVKLNRYGDVFITDLEEKVYKPLNDVLHIMKYSRTYKALLFNLQAFMDVMVKLPYDTPKCPVWKDAFKGIGSYKTLNNICKFHGVTLQNYETGELLDRDESIAYIDRLLKTYKNEYWKYHELLKKAIVDNNFDLRKSIESQKN